MELRNYQIESIEKIRDSIRKGNRNVILQAACGSGKTIIAAEVVRLALEKGSKVIFLQNRRDLVHQTFQKFEEYGIGDQCSIIMAGEESMLSKPVQVVSIQTYARRIKLGGDWDCDADLVIFDECHSSVAKTYKEIIDAYSERAMILGLTATPCRSDGRGLGIIYDDIVSCIGIDELIKLEYLVPMIHYGPAAPDLAQIKITAGDYNKKELGHVMDTPKLVGDIYDNWMEIGEDRQTIIFAVNVKHSKHIRDLFNRSGVPCEHIDAHTNDEDRVEIYNRFEMGDTRILTNVGICTEGSDFPFVGCIVIARPTKSYGRFIQMAGRGLRPDNGKADCILLDHSGCIEQHGFVDDPMTWSLNDKEKAWRKPPGKKEKPPMTCDMCWHVFKGKRCPRCGYAIPDYGKKVEALEAKLEKKGKGEKKSFSAEDKRVFAGMLEWYREEKGFKNGWLAHKYLAKFGHWPRGNKNVEPIEPDLSFMNWIKYQNIKWAKSKKKTESTGRKHPEYDVLGGILQDSA